MVIVGKSHLCLTHPCLVIHAYLHNNIQLSDCNLAIDDGIKLLTEPSCFNHFLREKQTHEKHSRPPLGLDKNAMKPRGASLANSGSTDPGYSQLDLLDRGVWWVS